MTTGSVYKDAGEKKTSDICGEQGNGYRPTWEKLGIDFKKFHVFQSINSTP